MALRRILKFPAQSLKKHATAVKDIDGQVDEILRDMVDTMYAAPGVGLAAPQVGIAQRMIVLDVNHEEPGKRLLKLVNPEIAEREGTCSGKRAASASSTTRPKSAAALRWSW